MCSVSRSVPAKDVPSPSALNDTARSSGHFRHGRGAEGCARIELVLLEKLGVCRTALAKAAMRPLVQVEARPTTRPCRPERGADAAAGRQPGPESTLGWRSSAAAEGLNADNNLPQYQPGTAQLNFGGPNRSGAIDMVWLSTH